MSESVYSFDIFDTLLSRNTLTAKGIFALMRQAIKADPAYPMALRTHFFDIRISAEETARHLVAKEETTLQEIYGVIEQQYGLPPSATQTLMALEERLEIENVYPVNETIFRIKCLLATGGRVVLISDMYLPLATVTAMVAKVAPEFASLPVYLSSEIGLQKARESLYRHVLEKEGIAPQQLRHTGDNPTSDFEAPSRLGIKAELFQETRLTSLERTVIADFAREYDLTRQLVGGTARKMRLHLSRENRFTAAAAFFGPILYGFVHDSLKRILASGKKRVYFVSRDGQPLKIIADEIIAVHGYELETHYIYGSRQAWRQAAIFEPRYDLHWLGENFTQSKFTLRQVLERLDDDVEKIFSLLPESAKTNESLGAIPSEDQIARVREAMASHAPLREFIIERSRVKRRNAVEYFRKSGLLDSTPYAVIDIGWTGKMQHCLYSILQSEAPGVQLEEFYFGLDDRAGALESDTDNRKHHYYIDLVLSGEYLFPNHLELFVSGDHGRCSGYSDDCEPTFSGDGRYLLDWGVREYYDCLRLFSREYARVSRLTRYEEKFRHLTKELEWYLLNPTEEMAVLFGSLPFSEDQNDALLAEVAPALSVGDARAAARGELKLRWEAASYLRSSACARHILRERGGGPFSRLQRVRRILRLGRVRQKLVRLWAWLAKRS